MSETLTVGELKQILNEHDDDVEVWVARGGATTDASSVSHSVESPFGEHITIQ